VASGTAPQLPLEAWLLQEPVHTLEYWQLRGYGVQPVEVRATAAEKLVQGVEEGMARLVETFHEGAAFAALADREGGGLLATGHCEFCALSGVCRRKEGGAGL
jgi:hypothetical protein